MIEQWQCNSMDYKNHTRTHTKEKRFKNLKRKKKKETVIAVNDDY